MSRAFWIVWSPQGIRPPSRRHETREIAEAEAERLARCSAPSEFFVMEAVSLSKRVDISTERFDRWIPDAEIPF